MKLYENAEAVDEDPLDAIFAQLAPMPGPQRASVNVASLVPVGEDSGVLDPSVLKQLPEQDQRALALEHLARSRSAKRPKKSKRKRTRKKKRFRDTPACYTMRDRVKWVERWEEEKRKKK